MESVIAGLLKQFEDGYMTRRQLIQGLALAAAAAAPVASAVAAQTPAAPASNGGPAKWKTVWLDHISYAVADYKRSTDFYASLMGWEVRNDNGKTQATLNIGTVGGIIIRNRRPPAADAQPTQANRPPLTGVINHISYGVQPWDTEAVKAELERRGLNPRPDMVGENFKSYHVTDPDGWDLQISNQTKDSRAAGGDD
ncbi:MAG: VOC family protein [Acidobacteria bacterium]|nr:VOC family protein [Acidobacteriota bacterium]